MPTVTCAPSCTSALAVTNPIPGPDFYQSEDGPHSNKLEYEPVLAPVTIAYLPAKSTFALAATSLTELLEPKA
jgi:hypothetical protein